MSFDYNPTFSFSEVAMPDTSRFLEMWATSPHDPAELALPHNSPYSAGFCEASPLPIPEPSMSYNTSLTLNSSHIALDTVAQQTISWINSLSNFDAAAQPIEASLQGERRLSDSSGTTDSAYEDYADDNHSFSLESRDTGATSESNFNRPIDAWNKVLQLPIFSLGTGAFVPQSLYQPRGETDRQKYVYMANLSPPILFYAENPSELGIALEEIVQTESPRLCDGDDLVLDGSGRSISVRIKWPGYPLWNKQLLTRDYRKTPGPITKARLAKNLARCIRQFIKKMKTRRMEIDADPVWKIGDRRIRFEDLILVSLHHVSQGSWQPQLRIRRQMQGVSNRAQ
ncbi:hypothetical protein K503DRAFT_865763 [Rhizopogon vinicolor AM-OR11-026]|uniref:Uncharacterized protein n=1 Tax=Rhizopogon vinicolor AM-OR11-026 TaxID=1314800 RepID=A0A1B7N2D2_9AGAM|nr:hypothetical protein K503DRAFT_865763 [Rhizopogon vinicolor AM-OR11-026]